MAFAPGTSGNPAGRPKKGETLTDALKLLLSKRDKRMVLAERLYDLAMGGDMAAMQMVWNRMDGKVPDEGKHSGTFLIRIIEGDSADDHEANG